MAGLLRGFYEKRAGAALQEGKYDAAVKLFRKAGNDEAAASTLVKAGRFDEAVKEFERLGKLAEAADAARLQGKYQHAADLLVQAGDPRRAVSLLVEANDVDGAARLCAEHGMLADAAELLLSRGQKSRAASVLRDIGQYDRAIAIYRELGNVEKLVECYEAKGSIEQSAAELEGNGEHRAAALLYERTNRPDDAAREYRACAMFDKAAKLYETTGNFGALGDLWEHAGQLDLAAANYEKAPTRELDAALLYSRLVVMEQVKDRQLESPVLCGAIAGSADALVVGFADRHIAFASRDFNVRWQFRLSGSMVASSVAVASDGSHVVAGTDAPAGTSGRQLLILTNEKHVVLQKIFDEPVKHVAFLPGGTRVVAANGDAVICLEPDGTVVWNREVEFRAWALDLSVDGQLLAVGSLGGELLVLDLAGNTLNEVKVGDRIHRVRFNADSSAVLAAMGDDQLVVYSRDAGTYKQYSTRGKFRLLECVASRSHIALAEGNDLCLLDWDGNYLSRRNLGSEATAIFVDPVAALLWVGTEKGGLYGFQPAYFRRKAAEWFSRAGRLKEAAAIFEEIEAYDKAYQLFRELGEYENAARVVHATGDVVNAARHYEVVGQTEKAARLYETAGELALAARCFGKAGDILKAAQLYEQLGDLILAADFYEQVGENKRAALFFNKASQVQRAVTNFENWLQKEPEDHEAVFELGALYVADARHDEAIRLLQKLTDSEKYKRDALGLLGECFLSKGLYDVAIDRLMEAIGPNQKPSKENIDFYYNIGCAHEKAGRFTESTDIFGKVMAIDYYYKDIQERLSKSQQYLSMASRPVPVPAEGIDQLGVTAAVKPAEGYRRYRIVRKLGQGGMGVVYLAVDERLNRQVAWKVLPSHLSGNKEFQMRLLREARAVAQLANPHIVAIYDIVTDENECYITMEYIDGDSLRSKLREAPQLPMMIACRHGIEIAEALSAAHTAGIVHRDVKPENIMIVAATGDVKMVDFGLARLGDDANLTKEGCIAGTIPYMAPEQIRAEDTDHRLDVYAFGVVLFEMLAGRPPFIGENVLGQHLHSDIPDLGSFRTDVSSELKDIVVRCLAKKKEDRPDSCQYLVDRLKELAARESAFQTKIL